MANMNNEFYLLMLLNCRDLRLLLNSAFIAVCMEQCMIVLA